MRSFILLAAIFAAANADGHNDWDKKDDWNKDMDMGGMDHHHDKEHHKMDDMHDLECMMGMCDSAVTYGATATVFAATMAALFWAAHDQATRPSGWSTDRHTLQVFTPPYINNFLLFICEDLVCGMRHTHKLLLAHNRNIKAKKFFSFLSTNNHYTIYYI